MPLPEAADVSVTYLGFCFGQRIMLTTNYSKQVAGIPDLDETAELQALMVKLAPGGANDVVGPYLACLPPEYTMTQMRAQAIAPTRYAYVPRLQAGVGAHADSATVANDSAAVTLRGFLAGRSEVSTKHIGPIPDNVSAAGLLKPAYVILLGTLAAALCERVTLDNGAEWAPVIYHRNEPGEASPIVSFLIGDQSRVQRRRTVGLGE